MKYGALPKNLGIHLVECNEMMFYQYLPIKLSSQSELIIEERLKCFESLIGIICNDYIDEYGFDKYVNSYIYLTAKRMYQFDGYSYNRKGYHSDGFLTEDINYVWCDELPSVFNTSEFKITLDDNVSLQEMEEQALKENEVIYPENSLLRLNQFQIHKVSEEVRLCLRTFIKVSFSIDKYDLRGNSKNYLIKYNWDMRGRNEQRNIPQKIEKTTQYEK